MSYFHPLLCKSGFPSLPAEQWSSLSGLIQNCHINKSSKLSIKDSTPSPHHTSICWTFPLSEDHLLLLCNFWHTQVLTALKAEISVVELECRIAELRTISPVIWVLQNSTAESTCTAKLKRCKWAPCIYWCIKKELQTLIFTVLKLTSFHLDLNTNQ